MKVFPMSTLLMLFSLIGQQKMVSSQTAASYFYQPILPPTNEPFTLLRIIFNKGNAPNETVYCNDNDYSQIRGAFPLLLGQRRALRSNDNSIDSMALINNTTTTTTTRELYPAFCADACAGLVAGTCRATRCVGYRRRNLQKFNPVVTCANKIGILTTNLDRLITYNYITSPCQTFIAKTARQTLCQLCNP